MLSLNHAQEGFTSAVYTKHEYKTSFQLDSMYVRTNTVFKFYPVLPSKTISKARLAPDPYRRPGSSF